MILRGWGQALGPSFPERRDMGWRKRPSKIEATKSSVRIPYHIGIVMEEVEEREKARKDLGMERPERIVFDDL